MTYRILCLLIVCLMFFSCSGINKTARTEPVSKAPDESRKEIGGPLPPAEDIIPEERDELRSVAVKKYNNILEKRRYNLDLKSGSVRDVLAALVKGTDIGLVLDPDVNGTVPFMDLRNASLREILDYVLKPLKLEYSWNNNNIHVYKAPLVTRFFTLNYPSIKRKGTRNVSYSTRSAGNSTGGSQNGSTGSSTGTQSAGSTGGGSSNGAGGMNQSSNNIEVKVENAVWETLTESLKVLVFGTVDKAKSAVKNSSGSDRIASYAYADKKGRKLIISPETGIIVVRSYEEDIKKTAEFIEKYQGSAQRQVWIEAKIVEVNLSKGYQMGVDWGKVVNRHGYFGTLDSKRTLTSPGLSFTPGSVENQSLNSAGTGAFQFAVSNNVVDIMLDAIAKQGNLKVLSNPRISALNNEKAVIRVVREEAFFSLETEISQGQGGNVTAPTIQVQVVPVGIVMDIIPQIGENGEIMLSVNPDISELLEVRTFEVNGASAMQPVIDRRSIDTVAKLKDGQTLVIAGIIKEKKNDIVKGVPFLYKVPLLGNLFRRTEQLVEKTELVIFLTPKIISGKSGKELTDEERERIKRSVIPAHFGDAVSVKEGIEGELQHIKKKK